MVAAQLSGATFEARPEAFVSQGFLGDPLLKGPLIISSYILI